MRRYWGVWATPFVSGCSVAFMQAPPDDHSTLSYFDCVSSTAAPVTDTVNAGLNGLALALTAQTSDDGGADSSTPAIFGGVAALYAASAIYGYVSASGCDSAKQHLAARIRRRELDDARRIEALEQQLKSQRAGCRSDADCKGDRVCVSDRCVSNSGVTNSGVTNSPAPEAAPVPLTPAAPDSVPQSAPVP